MFIGNLNSIGNVLISGVGTSYLLDTYTASVAYSLRQLRTGVTNVVRVRRSSDNAESDFTATEITDGTLATWSAGTDSFVVTWYDQSTTNRDITMSTAGSQAQLVSSGVVLTKGSLPAISFDGSNDYLDRAGITALTAYPFSAFAVASNEGTSSDNGFIVEERNSAGDQSGFAMTIDRRNINLGVLVDTGSVGNLFNYPSQLDNNNQRLQTFTVDGSGNGEFWKNGTSQDSIASMSSFDTAISANLTIGRLTSGSIYHNGYIQEVIVFSTDESANRTDIESDIDTHYWGADLLLDTYSGAAAAYSLRKLSKFTTNVVRVRRSSDSAESDFTADEITDGTLTTWAGANDGFVVTWYDQAGSSNVTQATAANQPQLVSSGAVLTKGSLPAVQFDGSNDELINFSGGFLNTTSVSWFAVASGSTTGTNGTIAMTSNLTNNALRMFADLRTTGGTYRNFMVTVSAVNYAADLSSSNGATDLRLLSAHVDASKNISAFDNGATGGTATYAGTTTSNGLRLGAQFGGLNLDGYITEFIAFNTDESANRTAIESDINTHYSIY